MGDESVKNALLTKKLPGKIFISYRRDDVWGIAGRLMDSLSEYFGDGRVFRDIENIQGGANFESVLSETIGLADAMIVLIGPNWLNITNEAGQRRLDDPNDWVLHEISVALQQKLPVIPVLIEDTPMPRRHELPDSLKPLVRHNAVTISDKRWDYDVTRLAKIVAFDIPNSAIEKKLDIIRIVISFALFVTISITTGILYRNLYMKTLPVLELWQSGITFVAIMSSSVLLLISARLIDTSKRGYIYASGLIGGFGTLISFILLKPLATSQEAISMFFGSTVIATAMFVFMNLSGFKPK
jgi:TIR domain